MRDGRVLRRGECFECGTQIDLDELPGFGG